MPSFYTRLSFYIDHSKLTSNLSPILVPLLRYLPPPAPIPCLSGFLPGLVLLVLPGFVLLVRMIVAYHRKV